MQSQKGKSRHVEFQRTRHEERAGSVRLYAREFLKSHVRWLANCDSFPLSNATRSTAAC